MNVYCTMLSSVRKLLKSCCTSNPEIPHSRPHKRTKLLQFHLGGFVAEGRTIGSVTRGKAVVRASVCVVPVEEVGRFAKLHSRLRLVVRS